MDHLFNFDEVGAIQVPLYGSNRFDGGPFASFLERQGLNRENLIEVGDLQGRTPDDVASFFQSWLYFSFLEEFFAEVEGVNASDFITTAKDGTQIITTAKLPQYLAAWRSKARTRCAKSPDFETALVRSMDHLFAEVYSAGQRFVGDARAWPHDRAPMNGVPEPLALSIIVLFEALSKAARQVTRHSFNYDWQTSRLLIDRMERDGWCQSELNLLARMKIDTLYSASTMARPNVHRSHSNCAPHCCKAKQVTGHSSYTANCRKHVNGCGGCSQQRSE